MSSIRKVILGLIISMLVGACGGSSSVPGQAGDQADNIAPADRISAEALHGCTLDDVTISELAGTVSIEFRRVAGPGKFVRLEFPDARWPDPNGVQWTIQAADRADLATAISVSRHSVDIGIIAGPEASPQPAAVTINVAKTRPAEPGTRPQVLAATAEQLSVIDLGDERVKLDWIQALPGDFDFNGKVELADLAVLAEHLGEAVDYEAGTEPDNAAYWLDSNHDGVISPEDASAVSANLMAEVAGFVIGRNSAEIDPEAPGTISVSVEQSSTSGNTPPVYSVELAGSAESDWGVAAVDSSGRVGHLRRPVLRKIDLVAKVNLIGMDLYSFPEVGDQGQRPGKIGARIIEPIDVVNRGTISAPLASDDSTFKFVNLPRDRDLLLDINYVPQHNLHNGQPVQISVGPVDSLSAIDESEATAVPFNLSGGSGTGQLNIDIFFVPNPAGGYWIEVNAISHMPGDELPSFRHTLLDYNGGVLNIDANGDDQFEPGWYFTDEDRDSVSDAWIEQNEQLDDFGYIPGEIFYVEGSVLSVDQQMNTIELGGIAWIDSPMLGDPLVLQYSEDTLIAAPGDTGIPMITPEELEAGAGVAALYYLLEDPTGARDDSLWLDQLILLEQSEL